MASHCIPEKVTAVCRPKRSYKRAYTEEEIFVRPAFVVDASSEKLLAQAKKWAESFRAVKEVKCITQHNDVMTTLRLVGVEHRLEGGLAYKVVTPQGYLVDLREEEFLEALFTGRIASDGTISGEYVWSRGGSQMRIVRVGSKLYEERKEAGRLAALPKIPTKDLKIGHLYTGRGPSYKNPAVYIGRVRYRNKLMFAWRFYYERRVELSEYVEVTTSHSYVKDLGLCPAFDPGSPLKGVIHYTRGAYTQDPFNPEELVWLE